MNYMNTFASCYDFERFRDSVSNYELEYATRVTQ